MIIAIDGPAGSGKSTTARGVASALGYAYLDTGAMYRAAALAIHRKDSRATDEAALDVLKDSSIDVAFSDGSMSIFLDGENVTADIRTPEIGVVASQVGTLPALRSRLVEQQRMLIDSLHQANAGVVVEGRDIGTVVAPDADLKFFMIASIEERARRRVDQLHASGEDVALGDVIEEIRRRDDRDRNRDASPLLQADDAIVVDTTSISMQEQIDFIVKHVTELN